MTQSPEVTPPAFIQNFRHNKVLHEQVLFLTVVTERVPSIPRHQQIRIEPLECGIHTPAWVHANAGYPGHAGSVPPPGPHRAA